VEEIIVIGASGHASVIIDCIEKQNKYTILGILDLNYSLKKLYNYAILGDDSMIPHIIKNYPNVKFIIAIGDNIIRKKVYDKLIKISPKMEFGIIIHPDSCIGKNVIIKEGTVVLPGVIINSNSTIKSFVILNTRSIIEHDCIIDDFASINPNAVLGGNVTVGEMTVICMGVSIIQNINIGKRNVIGANSLVIRNIGDDGIYYGIPSKYIRPRAIEFQYLK
jgi:sugar O-acyltransferase (sialic acid O-acetyltransferase NeuD family)